MYCRYNGRLSRLQESRIGLTVMPVSNLGAIVCGNTILENRSSRLHYDDDRTRKQVILRSYPTFFSISFTYDFDHFINMAGRQ